MNLKEKAKLFAIWAHYGQIRKNEPEKPAVIHPIGVAHLLEIYHPDDDELIAAAYLHDVVEDTKYTLDDIKEEFGEGVSNLVKIASEPNRSSSWEDRKQGTIDRIKNLSLREKWLVCADKIDNLTDIKNKFGKEGKKDFSLFKRGEEKQKWYHENVYKSLIYNQDSNDPLFSLLKYTIDKVFYLEETTSSIFGNKDCYVSDLKKFHAKKQELLKLKNIHTIKPIIISISNNNISKIYEEALCKYLKNNSFLVEDKLSFDSDICIINCDCDSDSIVLNIKDESDFVSVTHYLFDELKKIYLNDFISECRTIKEKLENNKFFV